MQWFRTVFLSRDAFVQPSTPGGPLFETKMDLLSLTYSGIHLSILC